MNAPNDAATVVNSPRIRAMPTKSSPNETRYEKNTACGKTTLLINHAYERETSGCAPVALAKDPLRNPWIAVPALDPVHALDVNFSQLAESHCHPTYILIGNQRIAERLSKNKKS